MEGTDKGNSEVLALFYSDIQPSLEKRKPYLIYSDNTYKIFWDVFISILLLVVCFVIPLRLALELDDKVDEYGTPLKGAVFSNKLNSWEVGMYVCDGFFLIDLILNFLSTYQDKDAMKEISNVKSIA